MTVVLAKRGNLDTESEAEGRHTRAGCKLTQRTPSEDEDLDQGDAPSSQGTPNTAVNYQQLGERPGIDSPCQPPERNPAATLISATSLQKTVHVDRLLQKPLSLGHFVTAALAN